MRWWLALVLSLVSCAVLAAEESRELIIGGRTALGTLRLPALLGPDVPLVLITHGTLAHKDMETIQGLSKALSERGIATLAHNLVLGLDRRSGMYDCGRPHDYAPDDAIPEIAAWLSEARKTSSRVFVLGHSRGANQVARYLAANSKAAVAGAILLAPATAGTEASLRAAYAETYGQSLTALLDKAEAALAAGRGGEWMSVPGFIYCRDAEVTARAFAAFYRADRRQDTASLIADVSLPILVLAAAQDKTVPDVAASFAPLASSAGGRVRLETIDDADHFFRDLAAEDAADRIAAFIAAVR
ncbi:MULTISPECIES: alpha/beta hydrolase [Bradyrhizobium]|jgi:alpha-beta hydrolase superfamily lysophospholipase|uniref:Alpha/beta fold hydrolase n=1 Tax=Bradyrhizobium denitrificans TaxID=2734912 RepID=A0ABS5GEC5_9BRAD|nr:MULTISPECIES: alpha/beta fold hydrolase [Bradyrhizobium]MBR1139649.1 alpha/beta fold hydrolase [Bradyrhizobium denitrificans]MDU0953645.1 alpha/beta fold hydrolase [Bradyrhizobium sp.]MDU1495347.1 alpha/beta fold hydrolase [Bradyrhizobium sp.]MDU1545466.1 alpha/beta fold hydrolase [Bradyrhizobium sp.]MDU1665511.1 alpha/beta fold hydrolase [Bradyrhizobium sp.]